MGWENVFHCEWNEFGQKVLKYYWPKAISYNDITKTDFTIHRGQIDVLSGGFPCQPFSTAGKRQGTEDDRHLWPEMLRAIREIQPRYVVGENVRGFTNWDGGMVFDQVQADLEAEGYEVLPFLLPACAVNAPHRRDRIWIVAHSNNIRGGESNESAKLKRGTEIGTASEESNGAFANPMRYGRSGEHEVNPNQRGVNALDDVSQNEGEGDAPDTEGLRSDRAQEHEDDSGQGGERGGCDANDSGEVSRGETTPDTGSIGQQGQRGAEQSSGTETHRNWKASWSYDDGRWPTQPPICSRNDGLPTGLSGITVSKHRKESIKGYGNAIVPQVAFEIFKVIKTL